MHSQLRLLAVSGLILAAYAGENLRTITETDLYAFHWIAAPQISPDGLRIVYTLVTVNSKRDNYDTSLWIIPSAGGVARQLTSGPRVSGAGWSPDGRTLAFLRVPEQRDKEGKPLRGQIYLLPMDGGEARPLTDIPKGATSLVWAPDGHSIAFLSTTLRKDFDKKKEGKDEEESDVRVIVRAAYRMNAEGYLDVDRPSHIWTVAIPNALINPQKAEQ